MTVCAALEAGEPRWLERLVRDATRGRTTDSERIAQLEARVAELEARLEGKH